jgi:hypothetical protein
VPEIVGSAVFFGGSAWTMLEAAEVTGVDPSALVAVTRTRMVFPTSLEVSCRDLPVAPVMSTHAPPPASQRCHWYAYVGVVALDHVPGRALMIWPSWNVPEIVGGAVLTGAVATCASVTPRSASTIAAERPMRVASRGSLFMW